MTLKNKTILLISPNKWGKMTVSKHHYAMELAKRGNTVYFLNPPNLTKNHFEITELKENLYLIDYKPIYRAERFLPKFMFVFLVRLQIKYLFWKINKPIDVLWSFSASIFTNLSWFKAKLKLFHPVDQLETTKEINIAKNANIVFSVSEIILDKLKEYRYKSFFINHGLSHEFVDLAKERLLKIASTIKTENKVKVAYVGNLLLKSLDRKICKKIIEQNPDIDFNFYGAFKFSDSNLSGYIDNTTIDFIKFLELSPNVILKGSTPSKEIANHLADFDVLLVLINSQKDYNKGSNSHKIIEYLSTGKVIVSNHLSTYKNQRELIKMVDEMHNEKLPELFKTVINNLEYYNNPELQRKRIKYALENTYEKQIIRIKQYISKIKSKSQ